MAKNINNQNEVENKEAIDSTSTEKQQIKQEKMNLAKQEKLDKLTLNLEKQKLALEQLEEKFQTQKQNDASTEKLYALDAKIQKAKKKHLKASLQLEAFQAGHYYDASKCVIYASELEISKDRPKHENALEKAQEKKEKDSKKYFDYISKRKEKGKSANKKVYKLGKKVNHDDVLIKYHSICLDSMDKGNFIHISTFGEIKRWFSQIPYETQKKIWGVIFVSPWIVGLIIFFLIPLFQTVFYSFNSVRPNGSSIEIIWDGFGQYKYTFNTYTYYGALYLQELWNSVKDTIINVPVILIFSLFIAVLLNTDFKGARLIKVVFFIPVVYNATIINSIVNGEVGNRLQSGMTSHLNFKDTFTSFLLQMGLGTSLITFIMNVTSRIQSIINLSGVQILIFLAAIQSIPGNLYEAADMEGCTGYEKFWKITFPMVTPMFLTCVIYTIVDSFTRSSVLSMINNARVGLQNYGVASAMSVLYFLFNTVIILVVFLALKGVVFYYDDRK